LPMAVQSRDWLSQDFFTAGHGPFGGTTNDENKGLAPLFSREPLSGAALA